MSGNRKQWFVPTTNDGNKTVTPSRRSFAAQSPASVHINMRSPEVNAPSTINEEVNEKISPHTRTEFSGATPQFVAGSISKPFHHSLGPQRTNTEITESLSPPIGQVKSNIVESPQISIRPGSQSASADFSKFYRSTGRSRTVDDDRYEEQSRMIADLQRSLKQRDEMLERFMEEQNKRNEPKVSPPRIQASFTIPSSEPVAKKKIPDYESMNPDEIQKYESKFRSLFDQLKNSYPKWNIEIPQIGTIPLLSVHEIYEDIVRTITTYQSAMKYKVGLVIFFAACEFFLYKKQGIRAFKNFTRVQIKSIHKYDSHLLSFAKSTAGDSDSEWPSWLKFLISIVTSITSFASIQGIANSLGWNAPDYILHEADKFVSPADGPAKLKSDGISEVPVPPTGLQDPNVIIERGVGLVDFMQGGMGGMGGGIPQAEEVKSKKPADTDYDDVYE